MTNFCPINGAHQTTKLSKHLHQRLGTFTIQRRVLRTCRQEKALLMGLYSVFSVLCLSQTFLANENLAGECYFARFTPPKNKDIGVIHPVWYLLAFFLVFVLIFLSFIDISVMSSDLCCALISGEKAFSYEEQNSFH